ncbi:MAG: S41 family peptidase [Prolixibacteraceae bacterium]
MLRLLLLICSIILSINSFSQSYWCIQNDRSEELLLTIDINPKNLTFEAYSRKEALKDMVGSFIYMMAKTTGKIKYPELAHGSGKISYESDTTYYDGMIDYPDNTFRLKAKSWKDNFTGQLTDAKNRTRIIIGERVSSDKPLRDYSLLIGNTFSLIEKYYWDANIIKSPEWQDYKREVNKHKLLISDDYELGLTMMWPGKKLQQIPHDIRKINKNISGQPQKGSYSLKILEGNAAYLSLNNVSESRDETDLLFKEIQEKKIEILILDLRLGRRNLPLDAALLLAGHLTDKTTNWGTFLTRKFTDAGNPVFPLSSALEKSLKNPLDLPDIINKCYLENGLFLRVQPSHPWFSGKIYGLIDKSTSSVAEAFAIFLKKEKIALLAGQKSAGSPSLINNLDLEKQYRISVPVARFYDKDGKSYQGTGIDPDILSDEPDLLKVIMKKGK